MVKRIRAHDWAATPLGPSETWPLPLSTAVEMMLAAPMLTTLAVGPERVFLYNDEAARHYGDHHPDVLGLPLAQAFAHEFAVVTSFYDRVFGGESLHVPAQPLDPSQSGETEVFDAYLTPVRDVGGDVIAAHMTGFAVGERLRAERRLRETEVRQAFLLKLSDALRPISDPIEIQRVTTHLLGKQLKASRVFYVNVGEDGETADILGDYTDGVGSRVGRYALSGFSTYALGEWRAGRNASSSDVNVDPRYSKAERKAYASVSTRAGFGIPLIKEGRLEAILGVNQSTSRRWTDEDVGLAEEVAERTWSTLEQARAEAALRESDERQAFLLAVSDDLRPLEEPRAIQTMAMKHLAERLQVERAGYYDVAADQNHFALTAKWERAGAPPLDRFQLTDFGSDVGDGYRSGRTMVMRDASRDAGSDETRATYRSIGVGARVGVPLVKGGRLLTVVALHSATPRDWTPTEIELVESVAERTWASVERAHAEARLRESEARLAAAFESVPVGVAMVDLSGRVVIDNTEYRRFLPGGVIPSRDPESSGRWRGWDDSGQLLEASSYPGARAIRGERVIPGQEMLFTGEDGKEVWTRVAAVPVRGADGEVTGQASVITDIHALKRSAEILRDSGQRQEFLLKLSDALRGESSVDAVGNRAVQMMAEKLTLDRFYLVCVDGDHVVVTHEARREHLPPILGSYRGSDFPAAFKEIFGRTIAYNDVEIDPGLTNLDRRSLAELGAGSLAAVAVRQGGERVIWAAGAISSTPRQWTTADLTLLEDASERTWAAIERARAEAALKESEERFAQFAASSSDALWIRNATTLAMEYVSPAIETIYGVAADAFLGDVKHWAALIVPDDRDTAFKHIEKARAGEAVVHEFRIQRPSDGAFRWIRNTDFPLHDAQGRVQRIGGIAEDVTDARLAAEHQELLLAELQHRVRNIMAMIRSITARTGERAASVPDYANLLMGRLLSLARVQGLLTREANANVDVRTIVEEEVSLHAKDDDQYVLDGPAVALSPKAAEVMALALHELATNALKYGAFAVPEGIVAITWTVFERRGASWLGFDWVEKVAPAEKPAPTSAASRRRGFGSELIEGRVPYELQGEGSISIEPGGARCHLEFPLVLGSSVLETGSPRRSTVFGGALDMTGQSDLSGCRVLVVEDDYYLATDAARALRGAGAKVLGPCSTEDDAHVELSAERPDAVVLDINLGLGASFTLARFLKERGISFVFVTGYDRKVIPAEFEDVVRLEKPFQLSQIVGAVSRLARPAG